MHKAIKWHENKSVHKYITNETIGVIFDLQGIILTY